MSEFLERSGEKRKIKLVKVAINVFVFIKTRRNVWDTTFDAVFRPKLGILVQESLCEFVRVSLTTGAIICKAFF